METNAAQDIFFRTTIGACNSEGHLRVYMQDVLGKVREAMYEREWSNGTEKNIVAQAKICSPIAVASVKLEHIRLYYLTNDNVMKEVVYLASKGWHEGEMNKLNFPVAPYARMNACFLQGVNNTVRVYCQMPDNTIQEFGWSEGSEWKKMENLGLAMPGSAIACTSFKTSHMRLRVYFQDPHHVLREKCWDQERGWYDGSFKVSGSHHVPPRAAVACTSYLLGHERIGISVFYAIAGSMQEVRFDGRWHEGKMDVNCIPGSEVTAISWGNEKSLEMRVYFQKGEHVSGISEWMYTGGKWKAGKAALPPA
ncbi:hypothetical protein N7488_003024 [Penicillium malachiteum]|nr:hypothetical protein N7488_003024 [Penicillium malachiteum]